MERMQMPGWCRSPYLLIPALCIWALVPIWVSHAFPQRPFERIGAEIILGGAMLMYWAWLQGWRKTLTETVPFFVTMYAAITITYRAPFSDHTLSGSFYSLLVVTAAATLYVLYLSLLGAALTRKSTGRPYWAEVRAGLRASCVAERSWAEIRAEQRARRPPRRSWAEIRAEVHARQQRPRISVAWVKAPDLAGTVEYDSMHFSGMRVEECTADWATQLSEVKTDDNGYFALPSTSDDPVHWVRFSWPGTETVHLRVELSPTAQPLLVRLKYWKPPSYTGYWPSRTV